MPRVRVCRLDELDERRPRRFEHATTAVCVAVVDRRPYAVADACPHRQTRLSGGVVRDGVITCPGHLWRFDLVSGSCLSGSREVIATYPCRVVDGWVEVEVPAPSRLRSIREQLLAHARTRPGAGSGPVGPGQLP
jgi:nitrite reductase (NADH) small subunit